MKRLCTNLFIFLFINSYYVDSQIQLSVDKWMEYIEEMASETEDEEKIQTLFSDLSYRVEHPFDLNRVTEEQLHTLPFLSDRQVKSLLDYREKNGPLVSLYELKSIDAFDFGTIELFLPFVYIGEYIVDKRSITVKNLLKYNSNELQIRYDQCFQQKAGYGSFPDSILQKYPNRCYLGEPFYTSLRYAYSFDDQIQFGVVAEKDAGEPFLKKRHKGYDFYSFHAVLKNQGLSKTLCIGDYKVSFGQGLVISNDFSPSRNAMVAEAERRNQGFRRHYSTNEQDYFRGIATTLTVKKLDISLFYSNRKMDAAVDSLSFSSLKTDGLHRLERDWDKRHTLRLQAYGGSLQYRTPNIQLGATLLSYSFGDHSFLPDDKPYHLFSFRGKHNLNGSVNYLLKNGRIKFYGETAFSQNGAWATLNALQLTPLSYLSFLLLHRYYDRRYQSLFGNAFSVGGTVQNEKGLYLGMQIVPVAQWKLSGYADLFRFPWLKYGIDAPSNGQEYMLQLEYNPGKQLSAYIRYKYREKEKNYTPDAATQLTLQPYDQQRLRMQVTYSPAAAWVLKTSADGCLYKSGKQESKGAMLSQHIGWKPLSRPFGCDLYAAWFHTDDYSCRISSYEKNILYSFSMPSFYGEGVRLSLTLRWDLHRLVLSSKLAHTHYFDRDRIGTDTEVIEGSGKTDFYLLVRWKF